MANTCPVPYDAVIEKIIADWAKHGIVIAVRVAVINLCRRDSMFLIAKIPGILHPIASIIGIIENP